jgi:hypothetical protein
MSINGGGREEVIRAGSKSPKHAGGGEAAVSHNGRGSCRLTGSCQPNAFDPPLNHIHDKKVLLLWNVA